MLDSGLVMILVGLGVLLGYITGIIHERKVQRNRWISEYLRKQHHYNPRDSRNRPNDNWPPKNNWP